MPTLYLGLAVGIIAAGIIAVGIVVSIWWRRRSARDATVAETISASPDDETTVPHEMAAVPDAVTIAPDESKFAPPPRAVRAALDLSQPRRVTFHLLLPTQGHARSAGQIARREGYTADVRPPLAGGTSWLCLLTREMIPSPEGIEEERAYLEELAEGFGGSLDRWEVEGGP